MSDREQWASDEMERSLAYLTEDVVFPATPDFSATFANLPDRPESRRVQSPWPARWLVAAAAILIAATLAVPQVRETLGSWFDFAGIRIEVGDRSGDPDSTVTSIGGSLLLGTPMAPSAVSEAAGFPVLVPSADLVAGTPETWLNTFSGTPVVSLIYAATADLPAIGSTDVGLMVMQIDATDDTGIMIGKRATGESDPRSVMVDGEPGVWISGGILYVDAGDPFWTYQRRSGNVLIWERDGITYRLECNLPLADALAIAESLQPVDDGMVREDRREAEETSHR